MILFSIGLPSDLARNCDALLLRLAEANLGAVESGVFNTLEEIATAAIRSEAHLVACSRQPSIRLQTEIVRSGRRFLVALGKTDSALQELLRRPGCDVVAATRELASSCATMQKLANAPGALVLSSIHQDLPESIARHFNFSFVPQLSEENGFPASASDLGLNSWKELNPDEFAIPDGALAPYTTYFESGDMPPIVWRADLFLTNESSDSGSPRPATGPIDITGRSRFLIYGPYINLPPGSWVATVPIAFSAETSGMGFLIEVVAGAQLARTRVEPAREQVIETTLHFIISESADQPVEVRVASERAAFEGRLALGSVYLVRQAESGTEHEERLIQALHQ